MNVQVRSCYYHPDRPAVAVCAECGVGICKSCTVKSSSGKAICVRCGNEKLRQEHKEFRRVLRERGGRFRTGNEFVVPGIIGTFLCIVCGISLFFDGSFNNLLQNLSAGPIEAFGCIFGILFIGYHIFAIPFCVQGLRDIFPPRYGPRMTIPRMLTYGLLVPTVSWLFLSFYLVRFFTVPKQNKS